MKIAFLTHQFPPSIGGMQQWNHQMARAFGKAGHSVDVYHLKHGTKPQSDPAYRYIGIPMIPASNVEACETTRYTPGFLLRLTLFLIRFIPKLWFYDIWHISFGEPALLRLFFVFASFITRTKLIIVSGCVIFRHPYRSALRRHILFALARLSLNRARIILVDGRDIAREITDQGISVSRIKVCYAGVDTDTFKPGANREDLEKFAHAKGFTLLQNKPVILYSARFSYENAPLMFLTALETMHDVQGVMIGNGILLPEVRAKILTMNIPIHLWGSLPYSELPLIYGAVDICLYPYTKYIGGISQVIPLSMSCGACVITTEIGDNDTLIQSGENGILVGEDDISAMRAHVQTLLHDSSTRAIRLEARKTIETNWRVAVRETMYANLLSPL